jgi:serine protease inhibitor
MTYAGARGDTERQMATTLHFPSREKLDPAFSKRLKDLKTRSGKGCTLKIANALWGQAGFGFRKDFLDRIDRYYGGAFKKVDFVQHPGKSLRTINTWADTATSGKIAHLLGKKDITRLTRLVLTNAVYFKGEWASRFQKENTTPSAFHVGPDVSLTVPMMRQTGKFKYADGGTVQVLELPYKGNALSMVVLLPRGNLADLEANLTATQLHRWLASLKSKTVEVLFPKFALDAKYGLGSTLAAMGMPDAFDERAADFSGMDGKTDLYIFKVIHQANIVVNEEGSEAAAATAVVMNTKSAPMFDVFRADHPFLFLILDKPTGTILFLGSLVHPK